MKCKLSTDLLRSMGVKDLSDTHIHENMMGIAMADAIPAWTMEFGVQILWGCVYASTFWATLDDMTFKMWTGVEPKCL